MRQVVLLTGSNLGNAEENLQKAKELLLKEVGVLKIESEIYSSEPWGFTHENYFLNQVLVFETKLEPGELLKRILKIEKNIGRIRNVKGYEARIIDVDILYFNNEIINSGELIIPHPLLHKRKFTLLPLNEVLPLFVHPVLKKTNKELLEKCMDPSIVVKFEK